MADRRMFAKSIVLSDAFLDMPMSARCLYFTIGMLADDDGFVGSPKSIMRQCGASQDDMLVLLQKRYVLSFESGVIVIKHWRMNNLLRSDRHKDTTYLEEMSTLAIDDKGAYTEISRTGIPCDNHVTTNGNQVVNPVKYSIDKISIDKDIEKEEKPKRERFVKPTLEEVKTYISDNKYNVNADNWYNYYESNGWKVGKNNMKNWKACIAQWNSRNKENKTNTKTDKFTGYSQRTYDFDELEKKLVNR